jgi:hypothetical protein
MFGKKVNQYACILLSMFSDYTKRKVKKKNSHKFNKLEKGHQMNILLFIWPIYYPK